MAAPDDPQLPLPLEPPEPARAEPATAAPEPRSPPPSSLARLVARLRAALAKHGRKLWWLHSLYACGLGVLVVLAADKGFAYSRWLIVMLGAAFVVLIAFFRVFGTGPDQQARLTGTKDKLKFYLMTYVLKNLYQGMLFFVLPFYWKAATFDSANVSFVILLGLCAFLATLDVVFDRVLMRWRPAASAFYAVTLFACLNLVIPALLPDTATSTTLSVAMGLTVAASWLLHVPLAALKRPLLALAMAASVALGGAAAYAARVAIPPVPMHLASAAVGPRLLRDGRLAMQVTALHESYIKRMHAVTDVVVPGGVGDRLYHVWRHRGAVVAVLSGRTRRAVRADGIVRLRSKLARAQIPEERTGRWSVDVMTADEQLVGRFAFEVLQ